MRRFQSVIQILCLSLWPSLAIAQVTMQVELGLQGTVRLEKWNPVTIHLHNTGPPVVGTLGVRVWRGSEFRQDQHVTTFTQPIELPYRSRKQLSFDVPITSITHPIEIVLEENKQVLLEQQFNLRETLNAEHIILGITHNLGLDFLATSFQRHTRVVYLSPRDLPRRWTGYDSVSAIVVKGVSLQALDQRQATALRHWIARGGNLIVSGDAQYALLQEPLLRELLPVAALGVQQLEGLPAFAERYGLPMPAIPLLAVRSTLRHGRLLAGTDDLPLLAERDFGKGRILFLAVDYAAEPLASWRGNSDLWKEMLQPPEQIDFSGVFAELGLLDAEHPILKLLRRPILEYPRHSMLSVFLLAYCGGLALLFWRLGKLRAAYRRYWLSIGLLVIAASGLAFSQFAEHGLRRRVMIHDLTTVEVLRDTGYAHMQSYTGLFSPRGGRYNLRFQHPETAFQHTFYRGDRLIEAAIEATVKQPFVLRGITLAPWTLRIFSTESIVPSPIRVKAQRYATGLTIRAKNESDTPLQGVVVIYQGKIFSLGAITPGQELFQELYASEQIPETKHGTVWQALFKRRPANGRARYDFLQEAILQHYFGDQSVNQNHQTPRLIGWLMKPTSIQPTSETAISGATLVVSPLLQNDGMEGQ